MRRHLCMWSLGWASSVLLTFCGLQSLSPGALALGHIRARKFVLSTYSAHIHTSPPTTNAFCAEVPTENINEKNNYAHGHYLNNEKLTVHKNVWNVNYTLNDCRVDKTWKGLDTKLGHLSSRYLTQSWKVSGIIESNLIIWGHSGDALTIEGLWITSVILHMKERRTDINKI